MSHVDQQVVLYLAAGHDPVGDGQEGQPNSHSQHRPALHTDGLLTQARQVLVPDGQELLLAVWVSDKLEQGEREGGTVKEREGEMDREREKVKERDFTFFFLFFC